MTQPTLDTLSEDHLTGRSDATGEPSWLRDRRLEAFKRFLDQAWPNSDTDEYWRSTPFTRRFDITGPVVGDIGTALGGDSVTDVVGTEAAVIRLVDGGVLPAEVPQALAEQGLVVTDLVVAARDHEALVRPHLASLTTGDPEGTGADEDRTVTVSDAAWQAGVFVHVPDEVELAGPVVIRVEVTRPGTHLPRILVVTGHHVKATVYLEHRSADLDGQRAVVDEVVEVVVGEASRVDVATLHEWSEGVAHLALQKAATHRGATYRHLSVNVGGDTIRLRPEVDLVGEGSSAFPLGVYFADEGQWFDLQPYIRHIAPRATSDVLYKGALQGRARTVFRGNVFVGKDAVGTDTNEENKSLILTDGARADSTPFLEILCSDIKAGHGSATGQIDARHLFYLESRGIPREQALRLIVNGFFRQVLDRFDLPGVEERALAHIEHEIDAADLERIGVSDAALLEDAS